MDPNVSQWTIAVTGFIQEQTWISCSSRYDRDVRLRLPEQRAEVRSLHLSRNVGSSVGISVVSYLLTRNIRSNHATIGSHVRH